MVGRDSVEPSEVTAVAPGSTESRPTDALFRRPAAAWKPALSYKRGFPPKIFRTASQSRCQIKQVKAIRAAARFSYLLFLRVRCPNPFFACLPDGRLTILEFS